MLKEQGMYAKSVVLRNGWIIDPAQGINRTADVLLTDGIVKAIGPDISAVDAEVIDCAGNWVIPGLIDAHCHLREPGFERKETIETGTMAAARGGFTTVVAMANLNPVPDNANVYRRIREIIGQKAVVRVVQAAGVTQDLKGRDLSDMATLAAEGVRIFSDDGYPIERASILYQALQMSRKLNLIISVHEEDAALKGYWPTAYEPMNEYILLNRDLEVLRAAGGHLHVQHLSAARSVELVRAAKKEGLKVTAEVCPHHLTLTRDDLAIRGTNAKMAPPLRDREDIEALLQGLNDGTIDFIATDHAPHTADDKGGPFDQAANGIVGFETAFAVLLTKLVHEKGMSPSWLIEKMTIKPANVLGLPGGTLAIGSPADVCVVDPHREWVVDSAKFASMGRNTPYQGMKMKGCVLLTFVGANKVFDGRKEAI